MNSDFLMLMFESSMCKCSGCQLTTKPGVSILCHGYKLRVGMTQFHHVQYSIHEHLRERILCVIFKSTTFYNTKPADFTTPCIDYLSALHLRRCGGHPSIRLQRSPRVPVGVVVSPTGSVDVHGRHPVEDQLGGRRQGKARVPRRVRGQVGDDGHDQRDEDLCSVRITVLHSTTVAVVGSVGKVETDQKWVQKIMCKLAF